MSVTARIGLLGPRRVRQGLGPFLARFVEQAGGRLAAVAGKSPEALAGSTSRLGSELGHAVRGYNGLDAMIHGERGRGEALDALVVASPIPTHEAALETALDAGLPVLCEKPLLWNGTGSARRAAELLDAFDSSGLLLMVNTQWPYSLPSFFRLHPELEGVPVESFGMHLSPRSTGLAMLPDSLPHPLSLLQTLLPDPDPALAEPRIDAENERELWLRFRYLAAGRNVRCELRLRQRREQPRPLAYAINGREVERRIQEPDYRLSFVGEDREIPIPDPLGLLVEEFVTCIRTGRRPEKHCSPVPRLRMLEAFLDQECGPGA